MNPMEKLLTVDKKGNRIFDIDRARALGVPESDLKAMNLYIEAEDDWITGQAANPLTVSSVLTENAGTASNGKEFTFTYSVDDAKANPEKILLDPQSNQPIFDKSVNPNGEEQEEVFRQYMRNSIRNKHNVTAEAKTVRDYAMNAPQPTSPQIKANQKKKEDEDYVQNVAKLYYGSDDEVVEAENFLRTYNPTIDTIDRRGDDLLITYNNGRNPETIKWRGDDGSLLAQDSWVIGAANAFRQEDNTIGNINDIVAGAGIDASRAFNPDSYGFSASDAQTQDSIDDAFKREILRNNPISPASFIEDDDAATKANISAFLNGTPGLEKLKVVTGTTGDRIIVKDENNNELTRIELDSIKTGDEVRFINELISIATNRASLDQKALTTKGKRNPRTTKRKGRGRLNGSSNNSNAPRPNGGGAPRP
jgi:hypothetical protein